MATSLVPFQGGYYAQISRFRLFDLHPIISIGITSSTTREEKVSESECADRQAQQPTTTGKLDSPK